MSARGRKDRGLRVWEEAAPGSPEGTAGGPWQPRGKEPKGVRQRGAARRGLPPPRSGLRTRAAWILLSDLSGAGVARGRLSPGRREGQGQRCPGLPRPPHPPQLLLTKAASSGGMKSEKARACPLVGGASLAHPHRPEALTSPVLGPLCAKCWGRARPSDQAPSPPRADAMCHTGDVPVCRAWSRPRPALMHRQGLAWGRG